MQADSKTVSDTTYLPGGPLAWRANLKDNRIDTLHLQDATTAQTPKPADVKDLRVSIRGSAYDLQFDAKTGVSITKPGYGNKPVTVAGPEALRVLHMAHSLVKSFPFEHALGKIIGEAEAKNAIQACVQFIDAAYKSAPQNIGGLKTNTAVIANAPTPTVGSRAPPPELVAHAARQRPAVPVFS